VPDGRLKQRCDRAFVEPADAQPLHAGVAVQIGQQVCERLGRVELRFTVGAEHEHIEWALGADQVAQ
jgi:hypothetical protein